MITDVKRLSGLQKVAILFTILGEGLSITLLKEFFLLIFIEETLKLSR